MLLMREMRHLLPDLFTDNMSEGTLFVSQPARETLRECCRNSNGSRNPPKILSNADAKGLLATVHSQLLTHVDEPLRDFVCPTGWPVGNLEACAPGL